MSPAQDLTQDYSEVDVKVEQVRMVYARIRASQWGMLFLAFAVALVFRALGWTVAVWLAVQIALKIAEFVELRWFAADAAIVSKPRCALIDTAVEARPNRPTIKAFVRQRDLPLLIIDDDREVRAALADLLARWRVQFDAV